MSVVNVHRSIDPELAARLEELMGGKKYVVVVESRVHVCEHSRATFHGARNFCPQCGAQVRQGRKGIELVESD